MLNSVPYDIGTAPEDVLLYDAHVLLSQARGVDPRRTDQDMRDDFAAYRRFVQGTKHRPPGLTLYTDDEQRSIGLVHASYFPDSASAVLDAIAVGKIDRGRGHGKEILGMFVLSTIAAGLRRVTLYVDNNNAHARGLYMSSGFEEIETQGPGRHTRMEMTLGTN